jgi:hypothetical protein
MRIADALRRPCARKDGGKPAASELRGAGAEIVDPFVVPVLDEVPRPPQTAARFKDDLTAWIARHPGVPFPSLKVIADSKLAHPLHQAGLDDAANARPVADDPETIEGLKNEARYRDGFSAAMDAARIDAVVFPTFAQLPAINGDRNTQITTDPKPGGGPTVFGGSLTFVASSLQWPAISVAARIPWRRPTPGLADSGSRLGRGKDHRLCIRV